MVSNQDMDLCSLSSRIMLREAEQRRRKNIRQQILEKHESVSKRSPNKADSAACSERQSSSSQWLDSKLRSELEIQNEAEKISTALQNSQKQRLEHIHKQTKSQLEAIAFTGVAQHHVKFRKQYEMVAKFLMSIDKAALLSCTEYNSQMKELITKFDQLIAKIKKDECGAKELQIADNLAKSLDEIQKSLKGAAAASQQAQEQEKAKQLAAAKEAANAAVAAAATAAAAASKQQSAAEAAINAAAKETSAAVVTNANPVSTAAAPIDNSESQAVYNEIMKRYQERIAKVKPLQTNEAYKAFRSNCKKVISLAINGISAVSAEHMLDKFNRLHQFMCGQAVKMGNIQISVNEHPQGRDYCILLMAKHFVEQGDCLISCKPQMAFPVASIIVSLWKVVPEFGDSILAYMYKECPFLAPHITPQKTGETIDEYCKTLGYRVSDGQIEKHPLYLKRQSGYARLMAAIFISTGRQSDTSAHPYSLHNCWRWFVSFVSLPPLEDISATILMETLSIVGAEMWLRYGKQFMKLLHFTNEHYLKQIASMEEGGGPKMRLEMLIGKILKEATIAQPDGILRNNFW